MMQESPLPATLADAWAALAAARATTISLLEPLSQAQLDQRPAPGKWSPGEVLDHLILADSIHRRDILELVERATQGTSTLLYRSASDLDVAVFGIPRVLMPAFSLPFLMGNYLMPAPLRNVVARCRWLPAQNPTAATPRPGRSKAELEPELEGSLAGLRRILSAHPTLPWERMVVVHPLLGRNHVPNILRFLANHESRHQEQLREALAASKLAHQVAGAG